MHAYSECEGVVTLISDVSWSRQTKAGLSPRFAAHDIVIYVSSLLVSRVMYHIAYTYLCKMASIAT